MNYYLLNIGDKDYKLVLTTRTTIELEKKIGKNPIEVLLATTQDKFPTVTEMAAILHASIQKYQHNISTTDCYDILDDYIADGNSFTDFISVLVEVFKVSGLLKTDKEAADEGN